MALRGKHKDAFEKQNGVGLGFMSFFVKATCAALKAFPKVKSWHMIGMTILEFAGACEENIMTNANGILSASRPSASRSPAG